MKKKGRGRKDKRIFQIYRTLYDELGPQNWWPGDNEFEIITGAILTQNTTWKNVEKAINNLKRENLFTEPEKFLKIPKEILYDLVKPSGFYRLKAERLLNVIDFIIKNGGLEALKRENVHSLRDKLSKVKGIGKETRDSILLYAFNLPVFVIDKYTIRILKRHGLNPNMETYEGYQRWFEENLPKDVKVFKEYHALLVQIGKNFCKKKQPLCQKCPIYKILGEPATL